MLCCVGLIGGYAVGQSLGGPWTIIAPAAGFGIGLVADMKLMKGHCIRENQHDAEIRAGKDTEPAGRLEVENKAEPQVEAAQRRGEPGGSTVMNGRKAA